MSEKNNKKVIRAWTFYDWANSSFPLVINSAVFPAFYEFQTTVRDEKTQAVINDNVTAFGHVFKNTELYSYFVSLALLVVCITAPILSGIADYKGNKKRFLAQFCILGSFSCAGLFFFDKNNIGLSMIPFVTATIGYWGSLVFYNAYLPEIATTDKQDKVSARGFALGYLGSSILLIFNIVMITLGSKAKAAGGTNFYPAYYAFVTVAIWWFAFAQYTLRYLPKGAPSGKEGDGNALTKGFRELNKVLKELKPQIALKRFLRSYFFYNMGVQTVMYMATLFAAKEIDWPDATYKKTALIVSILLIQFLGVAGAFLFSWLSGKIGNIKTLLIAIFIWVIICVFVFLVVHTPIQFYCVAASVGLVMGGIQALSRSTYSKLLPETKDHASYFSFFDVSEKLGIVLGVFAFGFIEGATGSMRQSVLALITFFALGFVFLLVVPKDKLETK